MNKKKLVILSVIAPLIAVSAFVAERQSAPQALRVSFGARGIQTISYRGVKLEDLELFPGDAFHIGHIKMTDLQGKVVSTGQYGWGENSSSRLWDSTNHTWKYTYQWGSISVQFRQHSDDLEMLTTLTNNASSGMVLDGASIFPIAVHFPSLPKGFLDASYPELSNNITGPGVVTADYGTGIAASVFASDEKPLYSGFLPTSKPNTYTALISTTTPDGLATFQPHYDRIVMPGHTDSFTVALRFAPPDATVAVLAGDAYRKWAAAWPSQLKWPDRRIIGTVYLASSPSGDSTQLTGHENNPRRYFNNSDSRPFDVTTHDGLLKFQRKLLEQAIAIVDNLQRLHAQGAITWDIEGEQYPQPTSYVCSPDQIAAIAPEMESVIEDSTSRYAGMKLDDAYFRTIRDAGFRVGVCVRPQHFTQHADGTAEQTYLPATQIADQLVRKMKYAHDRWGATLFYLDSTVESDGGVLDASVMQKAAAALPDSLLIPEQSTLKDYAYAAPFKSFLFHGETGTDTSAQALYPASLSAILVNDVDPAKLKAAQKELIDSVRRGDVLLVHADYWHANNSIVKNIYGAAGAQQR